MLIAVAIITYSSSLLPSLHTARRCCHHYTWFVVFAITTPDSSVLPPLHTARRSCHHYIFPVVVAITTYCSSSLPSLHTARRRCHHYILLVAVATATYCSSLLPSVQIARRCCHRHTLLSVATIVHPAQLYCHPSNKLSSIIVLHYILLGVYPSLYPCHPARRLSITTLDTLLGAYLSLLHVDSTGFQARSKDREILEEGGGAGPSLLPRRDHE